MKYSYSIKSFNELTLDELYGIMVLRQLVFIVEQSCPYLDADGKDQDSMHMMAHDEKGQLAAYVRILPKGISYDGYTSIGRVVNTMETRNQGLGKEIMIHAIAYLKQNHSQSDIKISAQTYVLGFYSNLGFEKVGEEYLEDDIPHHAMILSIANK